MSGGSNPTHSPLTRYLARWVEALPDDEVDNGPGEDKGGQQVPLEAAQVGDALRDTQHSSAEKITKK